MCIRDMECLVSIFVVASLELRSSSCSLGWSSSALAVIMNIQRVQLILVTCEHEWASKACLHAHMRIITSHMPQ